MSTRPAGFPVLPALAAAIIAAAVLVMIVHTLIYLRRRARLLALTDRVTTAHARLLSVKQRQLVKHDGYGNVELSAWIAHVNYFIDSVVLREGRQAGLDLRGTAPGEGLRGDITRRLLRVVNAVEPEAVEPKPEPALRSGQRYETTCQSRLEEAGWAVSTTPASGDQGADLIADRDGERVVIQCKFHAKPVGNKAVQEAYTARNLHGADHAAVVSNNSFTRSATELARANDVLLLHHDLLPELAKLIAASRARPRGRVFDVGRLG